MTCGWAARDGTGIGPRIMVDSGLLIALDIAETRQVGGIFSIAIGAHVVFFQTTLIGICKMVSNRCCMITLPVHSCLGLLSLWSADTLSGNVNKNE
jgi:hypothetical protein